MLRRAAFPFFVSISRCYFSLLFTFEVFPRQSSHADNSFLKGTAKGNVFWLFTVKERMLN